MKKGERGPTNDEQDRDRHIDRQTERLKHPQAQKSN